MRLPLFFLISLPFFGGSCFFEEAPQQIAHDPEEIFVFDVLPIFQSECLSCHGEKPNDIKGNFDMRSREAFFNGGDTGKVPVTPGQPQRSLLYQAVSRQNPDFAMPPKEGNKLSDDDVAIIFSWIKGGAPWPDQQQTREDLSQC